MVHKMIKAWIPLQTKKYGDKVEGLEIVIKGDLLWYKQLRKEKEGYMWTEVGHGEIERDKKMKGGVDVWEGEDG